MKYPEEEKEKESIPSETEKHPTPAEAQADAQSEAGERMAALDEKKLPVPSFSIIAAREKFDQYIEKVDEMFAKAKAMIVNSDTTNIQATELGTSAMTLFNKIVATKNQVPYYIEAKEYVSAVDEFAAMLTDKLHSTGKGKETIVSITKAKIAQFAVVLESQRRTQEALEKQARDDLQKKLDFEADKTGTKAPRVEGPLLSTKRDATVRTKSGAAYAVRTWTFEIEDKDLPRKLVEKILEEFNGEKEMYEVTESVKELNELLPYIDIVWEDTKLRKAVKDGMRNISGIRIFEKIDTRFKT